MLKISVSFYYHIYSLTIFFFFFFLLFKMNDSTTMCNSSKVDIFEIPHLISTISRYLRVDDLFMACLVDKRWNEIFHPFLYENIYIHVDSIRKPNFKKYGHLMKALEV